MALNSIFRKKTVGRIMADLESNGSGDGHGLLKNLTLRDLTFFGIAAIIGGGVFSTIGQASANGGPGIALLYLGFAIACVFSAYCYAQFASILPISGSAYTYAYTSFGEIIAWILGWNLILEYGISNVVIAISWSDYFTNLMAGLGWHIPEYFSLDYLTASRAVGKYNELVAAGTSPSQIPNSVLEAQKAWNSAPQLFGFRFIADLPALIITALVTYLAYIGIRESTKANNVLVVLKIAVILMVIVLGSFYVKPANWSPFLPEGVGGVMKGVAAICFAYIGFDAISTTAEECQNPQRDIPRAMMWALGVCTFLYVCIALVLTGMVPYKELAVGDPLAEVFNKVGKNFVAGIVSVGAVIATTSAILVYQLGQPRIWMVMSRDGLLPKRFSKIHPRYKTPSFSTILTGFVVGIPALFMNLTELTDLTSIGTLFAFALVCGGILLMDTQANSNQQQPKFKVPYINSQWLTAPLFVLCIFMTNKYLPSFFPDLWADLSNSRPAGFYQNASTMAADKKAAFGNAAVMLGFFVVWFFIAIFSFLKKLSLIPVLGLLVNLYLMTQLGFHNWQRFFWWCVIGAVIYFAYGYRKSKLGKA
jgi:basic amino acid/polyamine antiporter, APA family